jgi:hypothetical protein
MVDWRVKFVKICFPHNEYMVVVPNKMDPLSSGGGSSSRSSSSSERRAVAVTLLVILVRLFV